MICIRLSLPCTQQHVGWARWSGDLTVPYAQEGERERERIFIVRNKACGSSQVVITVHAQTQLS